MKTFTILALLFAIQASVAFSDEVPPSYEELYASCNLVPSADMLAIEQNIHDQYMIEKKGNPVAEAMAQDLAKVMVGVMMLDYAKQEGLDLCESIPGLEEAASKAVN